MLINRPISYSRTTSSSALPSKPSPSRTSRTIRVTSPRTCSNPSPSNCNSSQRTTQSQTWLKLVWTTTLLVYPLLSARSPKRIPMCRSYSLSSKRLTSRRSSCRVIRFSPASKTAKTFLCSKQTTCNNRHSRIKHNLLPSIISSKILTTNTILTRRTLTWLTNNSSKSQPINSSTSTINSLHQSSSRSRSYPSLTSTSSSISQLSSNLISRRCKHSSNKSK
jgi:hypothetical protein